MVILYIVVEICVIMVFEVIVENICCGEVGDLFLYFVDCIVGY